MGRHIGSRAGERCSITVPVRASRPRGPPAGAFAWRGELEPCVLLRGVWGGGLERRGRAMSVWGPALVGDGNYSCEQVVGGRDSSRE
jgi:hypothetical protein